MPRGIHIRPPIATPSRAEDYPQRQTRGYQGQASGLKRRGCALRLESQSSHHPSQCRPGILQRLAASLNPVGACMTRAVLVPIGDRYNSITHEELDVLHDKARGRIASGNRGPPLGVSAWIAVSSLSKRMRMSTALNLPPGEANEHRRLQTAPTTQLRPAEMTRRASRRWFRATPRRNEVSEIL
jgi:hypothetical protein